MRRCLALALLFLPACGGGGEDMSGWKKTEGGVKYTDLKPGEGAGIKPGQLAKMRYKGWLAKNGKVFDSNLGATKPSSFVLGRGGVIKGWDEGVEGMKPGGRRKMFIPSDLGYGERGSPPTIPANANLMFEVELVEVVDMGEVPDDYDGAKESAKWKESATGLRHFDEKEGTGDEAKAGHRVNVHYTGRLSKGGKVFDSSLRRGEPFSFTLGRGEVIKGWDEGVAGMTPGGKRKLFIPAKLGYGERGGGREIPPGAALVFDVELLEIKK